MGWNHDSIDWSVVSGVLYPGGDSAPAFWTIVAIVACVAVLWFGNRSEKSKYDDHQ